MALARLRGAAAGVRSIRHDPAEYDKATHGLWDFGRSGKGGLLRSLNAFHHLQQTNNARFETSPRKAGRTGLVGFAPNGPAKGPRRIVLSCYKFPWFWSRSLFVRAF